MNFAKLYKTVKLNYKLLNDLIRCKIMSRQKDGNVVPKDIKDKILCLANFQHSGDPSARLQNCGDFK